SRASAAPGSRSAPGYLSASAPFSPAAGRESRRCAARSSRARGADGRGRAPGICRAYRSCPNFLSRRLEPVLVNVDEKLVFRRFVFAPHLRLLEADQIERPLRQAVAAVGERLGIAELAVDALDPAALAAHVPRRAD